MIETSGRLSAASAGEDIEVDEVKDGQDLARRKRKKSADEIQLRTAVLEEGTRAAAQRANRR